MSALAPFAYDLDPAPANPAPLAHANFEHFVDKLHRQFDEAGTGTITLDMLDERTRVVELTGNVTFALSNIAEGREVNVYLRGDGSSRTIAFTGPPRFIGSAAPTALAANKVAVLRVRSYGATADWCVATWTVEP